MGIRRTFSRHDISPATDRGDLAAAFEHRLAEQSAGTFPAERGSVDGEALITCRSNHDVSYTATQRSLKLRHHAESLSAPNAASHIEATTGVKSPASEGLRMRRHEIHVLAFLSCLFIASIAIGLTAWL